ncbi:hypothetical protein ACRZ5S_19805 [Vibrio scophthalmi]|uniref:hypothetical protein n=1 Tax=Vibrio TaxID=662 RepID=UPI000BE32430|nr:hypothetical protein [Vibrio parahaemolyticus]ATI44234.1 hypothetical protein CO725_00850 [Vibrio parahaemolyticus]
MNMSYNKYRNVCLIPSIAFGMVTTYLSLVSVVSDSVSNTDAVLTFAALLLFTTLTTLVRYLSLPVLLQKHEDKTQEVMFLSGFIWLLNLCCFLMLLIDSGSLIMLLGMVYLTILFVPIEQFRLNFWRKEDV